jgi:hypothetical protein
MEMYIIFHQFHTISSGYQSSQELSITNKIIQGVAPVYLQQLLNHLSCPKRTRSTNKKLFIKKTKTNYGDRRYSAAAAIKAVEWPATTSIVEDTVAFKNRLKTWIFNKAFGE